MLGAAATGAAAALVPGGARLFAQPLPPRRLPLGEFAAKPKLVEALRRGLQVMRDRPGSDPTSWFFQCAVHAYSDEIYDEAVRRDPKVAKVDAARYWKQCPHFGQASANFLIWHRAYLYHFERILRAAAGEPELALPYWNYDEEGQRGFPEMFAPQYLDRDEKAPNPLYHPNRELAFVRGLYTLSEPVCAATRAREAPQYFSEPGVTGFGGDLLDDDTRPGALEQRPHNDLHVAVGGAIGNSNGAMADVPTAAFDPIFWVHHANIDRLWRQWAASPGKSWGPLPADEWFDETPWLFIDPDGSEVRKPRRFYLDPDNMEVLYADSSTMGGLTLSRGPVRQAVRQAPGSTRVLSRSDQTVAVPANAPSAGIALALAEPQPVTAMPAPGASGGASRAATSARGRRARAGALRNAAPPPPPPARTLTVRLSGIAWDRLPASGFAVYLAPPGAALDESSSWFLGTLNLFGTATPARGRAAMHQTAHMGYQDFDATRLLARVEQERLEVHVVPYSLFARAAGQPAPRADGLRIAEVALLIGE
ncbi:MAG: hypothetical protein QOG72_2085 [Sphingomonadales bacterium]|jgi:hypothetical protein|nr:hypothetical protein [Sphingomonadales bacterium]